jgi:hypothetical protein
MQLSGQCDDIEMTLVDLLKPIKGFALTHDITALHETI